MESEKGIVNYNYLEKEYGFHRYKCKVCGEYFWSRVPRDTCPDRPCSKYEFLYKNYSRVKPLSLNDVRKKFIEFLVRRGHGLVDPYPVLAKWRNDLYLTIASIVVFQPAVTEGIVDPPYNPLVIVQPSIRLTDIDNVGLTFGRHLSSFEMGGMHAFNKPGKQVYWSEGIFENTIRFFVDEIGVDIDELVFKEGWWEGGGNAGPAPEVLVDGMELATLVHMAYKVSNGRYELNPVLVVDCGYGIERIAWFTQKSPTGFHAVYQDLLKFYKDALSVEEPPDDVLRRIVYELSNKELNSVEELSHYVSKTEFRDYHKELVNSVYLYSTLDHVRTLMLMLSDGIVPSNTGEGYLARLVIRRLLRNLVKLGVEHHRLRDTLLELVNRQIEFWKGDYIYGKFENYREYINDVVSLEAEKFISTLMRGMEILEKIIRRKKTITVEDLVEIYDSHGIPPEVVAERAKAFGVSISIPSNFYALLASKHLSPGVLIKEKEHELPEEISKWASTFPPTARIFHEDPYATRTEATVLGVKENFVVLDRTVAYPWAGGQDHDDGVIIFNGQVYKIVLIGKVGDVIVNVLDRPPVFSVGDKVVVEIDWKKRYQLMKHHTATHIVLAATRKVLGDHVWQAGAEKTVKKARLDITHHKLPTREEIKRIEELANSIVNSRLDLKFNYLDRFTAESAYGLKIYQGGAVYTPVLRIVEIPGWDAQACFGTHLRNTIEVGGIKIINVERIQDGVIRLEFIAGQRLVEYVGELEEERERALEAIGIRGVKLEDAVKKLKTSLDEVEKNLDMYRGAFYKALMEKIDREKRSICGLDVVVVETPFKDEKLSKMITEELVFRQKMLLVLIAGDLVEISVTPEKARELGVDLRNVMQKLSQYGVKGGGKQDHVTGRILQRINKEVILEAVESVLCHKG
ncbi:MAG: alanine--tRNA ligase [Desulfurococcaceae archaeon]